MIKFFAGDNTYDLKQALQKESQAFVKLHGELAVERFDAEDTDIAQIIEATQGVSFLVPAKMIIISNVTNKELLDKLTELEIVDTTDVIVIIPKLDKRAQYFKKLSKHPGFTLFEEVSPQRLPSWLQDKVKNSGGTISTADARYLIERVGTNQLKLGNEIDKLLLYDAHITRQTIDLLTEPLPQTTVFQLIDTAFAGNIAQALEIYKEQRAQKVEPHAIMGMIAWQLHILALMKTAGDRTPDTIAKEAKLNPFVVKKSSAIARKMPFAKLKQLVAEAAKLDTALKTTSIDPDEAVQTYLVKLATS